jgi:hypothetical protein
VVLKESRISDDGAIKVGGEGIEVGSKSVDGTDSVVLSDAHEDGIQRGCKPEVVGSCGISHSCGVHNRCDFDYAKVALEEVDCCGVVVTKEVLLTKQVVVGFVVHSNCIRSDGGSGEQETSGVDRNMVADVI